MDWPRFQHALELLDSGRAKEALEEFRALAAMTEDPTEKAISLLHEINCHTALGNLEEARRKFTEAAALRPPAVGPNLDFAEACLCEKEDNREE